MPENTATPETAMLEDTEMPQNKARAKVTALDHLVLTVRNISVTVDWYSKNLGMKHKSFVSDATPHITRHALIFGRQKINLHKLGQVKAYP